MPQNDRDPAAGNGEASEIVYATSFDISKNNQTPVNFQQAWLAQHCGVTPTRAALVAELAWPGGAA